MEQKVAEIKFTSWYKKYYFFSEEEKLVPGDYVVAETELGEDLGKVLAIKNKSEVENSCCCKEKTEEGEAASSCPHGELKAIGRKAVAKDLEQASRNESKRDEILAICEDLVKKNNLPMKLVDVHFSFDGSRITFAFIADGRIDFRELVKSLTRKFQKSIRMHQIGVRDEAKIAGDIAVCGRRLCCQTILEDNYGGVSTEMAYDQQVAHRGLDRLAGVCGRLKCCLRYELPAYEELKKKFPAIGSMVSTPQGKGKVVSWHILKQTIQVDLGDRNLVEVPLDKIKK